MGRVSSVWERNSTFRRVTTDRRCVRSLRTPAGECGGCVVGGGVDRCVPRGVASTWPPCLVAGVSTPRRCRLERQSSGRRAGAPRRLHPPGLGGARPQDYAIVPILAERRWRVVLATCGAFVVSMAILWPAWVDYFAQFGTVSARLVTESGGGFSAFRNPPELVVTVLALLLLASVDLRAAGWLAIPAAWPATQFHYAILALPVISWPLGFALAFPSFITVPPTVVVYAIYRFTRARLVSRARLRSDTHVRTQERQVAHRS